MINVPTKPDANDNLPSHRDHPKLGDLAERILGNVIRELTKYGRTLRDEDLNSIQSVPAIIEAMTHGTVAHSLYLSTQPTGWGKTAILIAAVKAILSDPALAHVGIVILVNTHDQIEALIKRMDLQEHQYAVRVGSNEIDLNARGLTSLCKTRRGKEVAYRYAQVLFTTQQKISHGLIRYHRDFEMMPVFDYCGHATPEEIDLKRVKSCKCKRQVRLWDEAYLPIDPVIIGLDQVQSFANRLSTLDVPIAAATLTKGVAQLQQLLPSHTKVPYWFSAALWPNDFGGLLKKLKEGDDQWTILYETMFSLQGRTVKILRQDYNRTTVAISYRRSIPDNIEPLLIFDASGNDAMEYTFIKRNAGNLETLPTVRKTYSHLAIRHFDHRAGDAAYRSAENIEVLATVTAQAVMEKPLDDDVLVIHRKGEKAPATTLPALIEAKIANAGRRGKLHFLTWGKHRATNEYQNVKHVILIGILQAPKSTVIAMVHGTTNRPMHAHVSPIDIELMRMSRIIGDIQQAVGRSAVRQMTAEGDVPNGCTVDIIASSVGPMGFKETLNTLRTMFPEATVKDWFPKLPSGKASMEMLIVGAALALLGQKPEMLLSTEEWADHAGYSARTLQRCFNKGLIYRLLAEHGLTAKKQGQKWLLCKVEIEQLRAA